MHQHARDQQRAGSSAHAVAGPRERGQIDLGHLDRSSVRHLQRQAGNGAVATLLVQRQPKGPRDTRHPENFATYGEWLASFGTLPSFPSKDQVVEGGPQASHDVLGEKATRPEKGKTIPAGKEAPTPIGREAGDAFIDHPTDKWVRENLPEELRQSAYRLPANCADVAIVLRHVWLFSHNRSEVFKGFPVGVGAGAETATARTSRVGRAIGGISTADVSSMVNAYVDGDGRPIRSLAKLGPLLHPGDVLVWEHHAPRPKTKKASPSDPRTGGHTHTIVSVERQGDRITQIGTLQGNQPLPADTGEKFRYTPGRRIEKGDLLGTRLTDTTVTIGKRTEQVWVWDDEHTTLVVAGPPRAAERPKPGKEDGRIRPRLADWLPVIARAGRAALTGVVEASMREALSMLERGDPLAEVEGEARSLGRAAGQRLTVLDADLAKRKQPPDPTVRQAVTDLLGALQTDPSTQAAAAKSLFGAVLGAFAGTTIEAGWSGVGPASINAGERMVGHVRRIPIDGLPGAAPQAIVAVPSSIVGGKQPVDVLLHFHGWGPGFKEGRDIGTDRVEAQLEATKRRMIAILPQGGAKSEFGAFDPDQYIGAVFTRLKALGVWVGKDQPARGQIVVTGHSGGGKEAMDLVAGGVAGLGKGKLAEVALFDGINGPEELGVARRWVEAQLNAALSQLRAVKGKQAQEDKILATVVRFRAYHSGSATAKPSGTIRDWPGLHASLRAAIDAWFADHGAELSSHALDGLRDRIKVIATGQRVHEKMVGGQSGPGAATGTLQDALSQR